MGREIITIQAGPLANYVGAHYWNIQDELLGLANDSQEGYLAEEIDPTVVHRQVEDRQGNILYMPRAVIFDLQGSFGGASQSTLAGGQASEASSSAAEGTWHGQVDVHVAQRVQRSRFVEQLEQEPDLEDSEPSPHEVQAAADGLAEAARELNAEGGVRSWTDFLKVYLHPQSLCLLPGLWQGACDFSGFGHGSGVLSSDDFREEALDRVRMFAEECDALQGFQYFVEDLTGFGQFSHDLLQLLSDDYPRSPIMLYTLRMPQLSAVASRERRMSEAASLARLSEVASLYVPLAPPTSIPCVRWKPDNLFYASALCAAVIEATSTPYRVSTSPPPGPLGLPTGACDLASLAELLRPCQSNNLVGAFAALPCPELPNPEALQAAQDARQASREAGTPKAFTQSQTLSWTPRIPSGLGEKLAESVVLRGGRRGGQLLRAAEAAQALDAALMQEGTRCVRHRCVTPLSIPIPLAFPEMFERQCFRPPSAMPRTVNGAHAQQNGAQSRSSQRERVSGHALQADAASSVPALTRLCVTPHAGQVAREVLQDFQGVARSGPGSALLQGWSYTSDDVAEIRERLQQMASCYDNDDSADAF